MKALFSALFVCSALLGSSATAQDAQSVAQAKVASTSWLALVDAGNYSASWDKASSPFKLAINKPSWVSAITAVRAPLGKLRSREVQSATFTHTLPGAPYGDYVVIKYTSHFATNANAIETVTPMREKDGTWHVSGYFEK